MRRFSTSIALALSTLLLASVTSAQQTATTSQQTATSAQQTSATDVPNLIRYGGTLKDAQGAPHSSTTPLGVTFAIYKQQDGGPVVWQETQNVTPDANGQYSVILGSTTATGLPDDLFSQQEQRWLGVQVQGEAEQTRVLLVSVPYAFKAHEAETLGGLPASAFVKAAPTDTADGTSVNPSGNAGNAGGTAASGKTKPPSQTPGFIPVYNGSGYNDSLMSQALSGATAVNDNGNFNVVAATGVYQIGGNTVLTVPGDNLFVGDFVGAANTGNGNTFVGDSAGNANLAGSQNTFVGLFAGSKNTSGTANTFMGWRAGIVHIGSGSTTDGDTFIGTGAGASDQTGSANTFIGFSSGQLNKSGTKNTYLGTAAGLNALGNDNTFAGYSAGWSGTAVRNTGSRNTFIGESTGTGTTSGSDNAFYGYLAGRSNSSGSFNTFIGDQAGAAHVIGDGNTYVGSGAGQRDTGSAGGPNSLNPNSFFGFQAGFNNVANSNISAGLSNTFIGYQAGWFNSIGASGCGQGTCGSSNTFVGDLAGNENTTGQYNTFLGESAGLEVITGEANTYLGTYAGYYNAEGNVNIAVGDGAGIATAYGDFNIYVGNLGCNFIVGSNCKEWSTIRIGTTPTATGIPGQNATFIAGIYGHGTTSGGGGTAVYISSDGKLGTSRSSRRFKEQIADMGDSSSGLFQLRPVTFFYKPQYDDGSHELQYGLIAEEVAKVYPQMVAYGNDGQPFTVKYELLGPMLLNELQKQHTLVAAQQNMIKTQQGQVSAQQQQMQAQQQQIEQLQQRLTRLESLIANK